MTVEEWPSEMKMHHKPGRLTINPIQRRHFRQFKCARETHFTVGKHYS